MKVHVLDIKFNDLTDYIRGNIDNAKVLGDTWDSLSYTSAVMELIEKEYNCVFSTRGLTLEFNNNADATAFLLKWT